LSGGRLVERQGRGDNDHRLLFARVRDPDGLHAFRTTVRAGALPAIMKLVRSISIAARCAQSHSWVIHLTRANHR
jgi:hypothetical protein